MSLVRHKARRMRGVDLMMNAQGEQCQPFLQGYFRIFPEEYVQSMYRVYTEYRVQSTEYRVQGTEYRVHSTQYTVHSSDHAKKLA